MFGELTVNATIYLQPTPLEGYPQTEPFTAAGFNSAASLALYTSNYHKFPDAEDPDYDMEFTGNLVASGGSNSTFAHLDGTVNLRWGVTSSSQTGSAKVEGTLCYYYGVASSPRLPQRTPIPLTVSVQREADCEQTVRSGCHCAAWPVTAPGLRGSSCVYRHRTAGRTGPGGSSPG